MDAHRYGYIYIHTYIYILYISNLYILTYDMRARWVIARPLGCFASVRRVRWGTFGFKCLAH